MVNLKESRDSGFNGPVRLIPIEDKSKLWEKKIEKCYFSVFDTGTGPYTNTIGFFNRM